MINNYIYAICVKESYLSIELVRMNNIVQCKCTDQCLVKGYISMEKGWRKLNRMQCEYLIETFRCRIGQFF